MNCSSGGRCGSCMRKCEINHVHCRHTILELNMLNSRDRDNGCLCVCHHSIMTVVCTYTRFCSAAGQYTFTVSIPIVAGWSFCNVYYPTWKALKCDNFTVLAMWVVFIDAKSQPDSIDYALPYCIILNDCSFKFYGSPQIISYVIALWWSIVGNSWRTASIIMPW